MELTLFHITCKEYSLNEIVKLSSNSFYHEKSIIEGQGWVDEFLDFHRPNAYPSRKRTLYACDSLPNCKSLKSTVARNCDNPFIYRVKMINPVKAPMALLNFMLKKGENNPSNELIAAEYWSPSDNWNFYEFLSEEMIIQDIIIHDDSSPIDNYTYWKTIVPDLLADDFSLANRLFNNQK